MYHVCIAVAADEDLDVVSRLLSLVIDPTAVPVQQLGVPLCPQATVIDPETDPYGLQTHWMGAWTPITHEKLTAFQNLSNSPPTPPGGWPWVVGGITRLTEAEAATAAGKVTFYTLSQEMPDNQLQHTLLAAVRNATGLKTMDV